MYLLRASIERMICLLSAILLSGVDSFTSSFQPRRPPPSPVVPTPRTIVRLQASKTNLTTINGALRGTSASLLNQFSEDLARLEKIRPPVPSADYSAPKTIISAGSSYTRLWTADTWRAHSRVPHARYFRHVVRWRASTTARKILPMVLISVAWSLATSTASHTFRPLKSALDIIGASSALSYLAAPLALLLTLRANASMSRIVEARLLWGRLLLHVRGLASILGTYVLPHHPETAVLLVRHLAGLGWILKAHLRGESMEREEEVLQIMLGDGSRNLQWLIAQPKRTTAIVARVRRLAASALTASPDTARMSSILLLIEDRISEIELCLGGCDRLFTSPIPPTYSRHLSRVMFLWLLLLPMSLAAMNLCTLGIVLPTAVATYVLVGIDEVGMEIENAFQLLPLQQLSAATQNAVRDEIVPASGQMP